MFGGRLGALPRRSAWGPRNQPNHLVETLAHKMERRFLDLEEILHYTISFLIRTRPAHLFTSNRGGVCRVQVSRFTVRTVGRPGAPLWAALAERGRPPHLGTNHSAFRAMGIATNVAPGLTTSNKNATNITLSLSRDGSRDRQWIHPEKATVGETVERRCDRGRPWTRGSERAGTWESQKSWTCVMTRVERKCSSCAFLEGSNGVYVSIFSSCGSCYLRWGLPFLNISSVF